MSEPRRNPKRKAPESSKTENDALDHLLERSCAPLSEREVEEWQGWAELESEPAFFNSILSNLGVKDVKTLELLTLDLISLDALPKPVFGLIFLFRYSPALDSDDEQDTSQDGVWFANQTTHNACATVALLNIIMNAVDIDLGDQLLKFKEDTKDLSTPLRGHSISTNKFIRSIHNSFARRIDHLDADLALENEVAKSKRKQKRNPKRQKRKSVDDNYGFHFIAYVPSGGYVWELDGLNRHPHKIGEVSSNEWTQIVGPQIELRMQQYEDSQLSFNLLALCRSPLVVHSQTIARSLASIRSLERGMQHDVEFQELVSADKPLLDGDMTSRLAEFSLTPSDIDRQSRQLRDFGREMSAQAAYRLRQILEDEANNAMGEYRGELFAIADDQQRVEGRKRDFRSAIHCWVSKLAEKGVLEDIIKMS